MNANKLTLIDINIALAAIDAFKKELNEVDRFKDKKSEFPNIRTHLWRFEKKMLRLREQEEK